MNRTFIGFGTVGIAALALLWYLFRPELLFVNTTVNEPPPVAAVVAPTAVPQPSAVPQPTVVPLPQPSAVPALVTTGEPAPLTTVPVAEPTAAVEPEPTVEPVAQPVEGDAPTAPVSWTARFQSLAHETTGTVLVRELEDGSRVLRLEAFSTSNGPDVRVYLVRGGDGTQDEVINRGDFVDLGALKGNIGDQNYLIPPEIDLAQYQAVSIWCRRFSENFGATSRAAGA